MMSADFVWIFLAEGGSFPGGAFLDLLTAEEWIKRYKLNGTLTKYPTEIGVYDWAVKESFFKPGSTKEIDSKFVGRFTSASMEHHHYVGGFRTA